jgi:hypothetical protein
MSKAKTAKNTLTEQEVAQRKFHWTTYLAFINGTIGAGGRTPLYEAYDNVNLAEFRDRARNGK